VGAVQHVFRRGATYWWRRRLIKKTGESGLAPIAISLRTREPVVARTIAAHLTLESDHILREGHRRMLSAQQVNSPRQTMFTAENGEVDVSGWS
jgi:hypothetical protein